MTLEILLKLLTDKNCSKVYVKRLSSNDNSKNQVYIGGSFEVLNVLPVKEIISDNTGNRESIHFKSRLDFCWINNEGTLNQAPHAQLILYPKYPEVRFSGFLKGVKEAPSELMTSRQDGRLLFFGISNNGQVIGFITSYNSPISREFDALKEVKQTGVFKEITLQSGRIQADSRELLLAQLKRIHSLGWIDAKRLNSFKEILPCTASNCGGYTLEAELGITPNGYSEPDYLGWEVKQFSVKNFSRWDSEIITLMTPEPTHGFYSAEGVEAFIRKYGYKDKKGREARLNVGGRHKYHTIQDSTGLRLIIEGIDKTSCKITSTDGYIGLIDKQDNIAASWAFTSLLKHWNTKHAKACYVPSLKKETEASPIIQRQYAYGSNVMLGEGADFSLVLQQIIKGNVFYDPGIKLEMEISGVRKQFIKRRSQFRINSGNIPFLYKSNEVVSL